MFERESLNVAARSNFDASVGAAGFFTSVHTCYSSRSSRSNIEMTHLLPEEAGAQTWSASCEISMSTPQFEHLMVGRKLSGRSVLAMTVGSMPDVPLQLKAYRIHRMRFSVFSRCKSR